VAVSLAACASCDLAFPIVEGSPDGSIFDAASMDGDVTDSTADASGDIGPTTYQCGPSIMCPLSDVQIACCVITNIIDASTKAPESYEYACVTGVQCAQDNGQDSGSRSEIHCDNGADCPNPDNVCCWPSAATPTTTYCFAASATNCAVELCNPSAQKPCIDINHIGYVCVSVDDTNLGLAPRGYFVCVPPDGG
jgi:hypothetical protein